ncbi:MAG TPA: carbohydrate binding domain-containing protein [Capsulimonadaceae bacterium]
MKKQRLLSYALIGAVASLMLSSVAARAQTPIVSFSSSGAGWATWLADDAKATIAPDTSGPQSLTELLLPTNDLKSWTFAPSFPDQFKSTVEGTAIRLDVGKVEGDAWRTNFSQGSLPLKEGQSYVLTFKAKADQNRNVYAIVQNSGGDWHNVGLAQEVALSTSWQTFTYPFTASNLTPDGTALFFHLGQQTGTTWFSDVSVKLASGTVTIPAPKQAVKISITAPGSEEWHIQYNSDPFEVVDGHKYSLSFAIKSDVPRRINFYPRLNCPDWHAIGDGNWGITVSPVWSTHTVIFTAKKSLPGHNVVGFNVGGPQAGASVSIGDVKLVEVTP